MLDRPTLTKARAIKEPALDITRQGKRSLQQFQLTVDGQIKDSFATFEAAEKTGLKIKKAHPVVRISVCDSMKGRQTIIGAEKA